METPSYCKVGFVVYLIALVCLVVSFATPYWLQSEDWKAWTGLWQSCYENTWTSETECAEIKWDYRATWFKWTAVLMTISLVLAVIAGCTHMYMPVTAAFQILAGCSTLSAIILFGVKISKLSDNVDISESPLYWSYWLGCVAAIIFLWNGLFLAAEARCDMQRKLPCEKAATDDESPNIITGCGENGNTALTETPGCYVNLPPPPVYETNPMYSANPPPVYTVQNDCDQPPAYSDLFGKNQENV